MFGVEAHRLDPAPQQRFEFARARAAGDIRTFNLVDDRAAICFYAEDQHELGFGAAALGQRRIFGGRQTLVVRSARPIAVEIQAKPIALCDGHRACVYRDISGRRLRHAIDASRLVLPGSDALLDEITDRLGHVLRRFHLDRPACGIHLYQHADVEGHDLWLGLTGDQRLRHREHDQHRERHERGIFHGGSRQVEGGVSNVAPCRSG